MVAPINSNKHYVHQGKTTIASGTVRDLKIVDAVVAPAVANAFEVRQGAIVKAIHFEYWLSVDGNIGDINQMSIVIEKVPAGQAAVTFAQISNLGAYPNKKNILWTFQGLVNDSNGVGAIAPIRDWLLIPKGKQRMGLGDEIHISISSTITVGVVCGLSTYKEYT